MNTKALYPLKFYPILKQAPWGGERIIPFKQIDSDMSHVGESWEISNVPGSESVVSNGDYAEKTITQLIDLFKERLVGKKIYQQHGNNFPLLIKFIDAKQDLSIQVHPDDQLAQQRNSANGKTEMWYIVEADPHAFLLSGFKKQIDKQEYLQRAYDGSICEVIQQHPVRKGDCFFVPAGQVHAICANIFLIEIQQTSDITYRIYDYNRKGIDGKLRQLHIKEAEDAIDFSSHDNKNIDYTFLPNRRNEMVNCPYFTTSVYQLTKPFTLPLQQLDSFVILIAYQGSFTLKINDSDAVQVKAGESVLIPAEADSALISPQDGDCNFLCVHVDEK